MNDYAISKWMNELQIMNLMFNYSPISSVVEADRAITRPMQLLNLSDKSFALKYLSKRRHTKMEPEETDYRSAMAIAEEAEDLKLAVQIMAGHLASGRYTEIDEYHSRVVDDA